MTAPVRWRSVKVHAPKNLPPPATPPTDARSKFIDMLRSTRASNVKKGNAEAGVSGAGASELEALWAVHDLHGLPEEPEGQLPADDQADGGSGDSTSDDDTAGDGEGIDFAAEPLNPMTQVAAANAPAGVALTTERSPLVDYLASTITGFCNDNAVRHGDDWRVRIDLNPAILPSTTLALNLSPHWLLLRFECTEIGVKNLISTHTKSLNEALENAISPRREISIEID